jgi:hypothetical protein
MLAWMPGSTQPTCLCRGRKHWHPSGLARDFELLQTSTESLRNGRLSPLAVTVRDIAGNPVVGAAITFGVPGLLNGTLVGTTVVTNASGVASVSATAPPVSMSYVIGATVSGLPPVFFTLTSTP